MSNDLRAALDANLDLTSQLEKVCEELGAAQLEVKLLERRLAASEEARKRLDQRLNELDSERANRTRYGQQFEDLRVLALSNGKT